MDTVKDLVREGEIIKILNDLQPLIASHGGTIEFVRYTDDMVYVRLLGACTHCPFSAHTIKLGIEERLRAIFPEVRCVTIAS